MGSYCACWLPAAHCHQQARAAARRAQQQGSLGAGPAASPLQQRRSGRPQHAARLCTACRCCIRAGNPSAQVPASLTDCRSAPHAEPAAPKAACRWAAAGTLLIALARAAARQSMCASGCPPGWGVGPCCPMGKGHGARTRPWPERKPSCLVPRPQHAAAAAARRHCRAASSIAAAAAAGPRLHAVAARAPPPASSRASCYWWSRLYAASLSARNQGSLPLQAPPVT